MAIKSYTSNTDSYMTPENLYRAILCFLNISEFSIDVCCSEHNIPAQAHLVKTDIKLDNSLFLNWSGICFMNPPWSETEDWLFKAFYESNQRNAEIWCILPADRLNMIYFNSALRTNSNWFMAIPQTGRGQKFNFYNPHISKEENEQNVKNGGFKKPFMILYIGQNASDYKAKWKKEQPLTSLVLAA